MSIKEAGKATDNINKAIADVNIATNSVFIAADLPALALETVTSTGVVELEGLAATATEFAGPVGTAVSVSVIVAAQLVEAGTLF